MDSTSDTVNNATVIYNLRNVYHKAANEHYINTKLKLKKIKDC